MGLKVKLCGVTGVLILLAIQAALLAYTAFRFTPVYDEPGHLVAGIAHWQFGSTELYRVNPPLPRAINTAIPYLLGARIDYRPKNVVTFDRTAIHLGFDYFIANPESAQFYLGIARLVAILWSLLGTVIIYRWTSEMHGPSAGIFSAAMWTFSPLVLGNSQLILPDVASAALGLAAAYVFVHWLKSGTMLLAFVAGVSLGLAELAKFTLIILFPLWVLLWALWGLLDRRPIRQWGLQFLQLAFIQGTALLLINAGYNFEGTFTKLGDYQFLSKSLRGQPDPSTLNERNRFADTFLGQIPVPLPSNMMYGIDVQQRDFDDSTIPSFLNGVQRKRGWLHYYANAFCIKEPLAYLFILAITTLTAFRWTDWRGELVLVCVPVTIFVLVSLKTGFNHHLRYLLPAVPFLFVWAGRLMNPDSIGPKLRMLCTVILGFGVANSLAEYPYSYSYFNSLVGGSENGYRYLASSNVEWGQAGHLLPRLRARFPGIRFAKLLVPVFLRDRAENSNSYVPQLPLDEIAILTPEQLAERLSPGWYAIPSPSLSHPESAYYYFSAFNPVEIFGNTVRIYKLTKTDVESLPSEIRRKISDAS